MERLLVRSGEVKQAARLVVPMPRRIDEVKLGRSGLLILWERLGEVVDKPF